jgi:DNA-binding transcriptional MerR regulator
VTAPALLPIGELAAATGVAVSALRHYDEVGVIATTARVGGKRRFSADAVGRVNFVRRAQSSGFSLAEIRDILNDTAGEAHQIVDDKLAALRDQQVELAMMIAMLEQMQTCGCQVIADCPAIAEPC